MTSHSYICFTRSLYPHPGPVSLQQTSSWQYEDGLKLAQVWTRLHCVLYFLFAFP